ncbi:AAA family ATPase [Actinomadura sp. WMMB 499]|uniref:HelD family protein n=1 Tax=Actinomadura sp. WMMB 499 TaxID=1219491 RepID=UPI001247918F|nr:AAA family ATPase [Actinomadura sp. WMMB 499]QFG20503.1 AAA family ATPase [Actinomadura sp. WMMB 499]
MTDRHSTLAEEQRAVDHAYRCYERTFADNRERFRPSDVTDSHAGTSFIPDVAPEVRLKGDLDGEALVIARVDAEEDGETRTWYIGRRLVRDELYEPFVINWQAPQATEWMLRRPDEPGDLRLRRRLRCDLRRVRDFRDEIVTTPAAPTGPVVVAEPAIAPAGGAIPELVPRPLPASSAAEEGAPPAGMPTPQAFSPGEGLRDFLLEDLERDRDGRMRDIVETIQREQLLLVSDDRKGVLVVQGGPGTGKSAIGLHRVSWLLFNRWFKTEEVLVVGPHRGFLEYVRDVLPDLGNHGVRAVELHRLWDDARGRDPHEARLVKSDVRMAEVLRRAVRALPRTDAIDRLPDGSFDMRFEGADLSVSAEVLREFVEADESAPLNQRKRGFATRLVDLLMREEANLRRRHGDHDVRRRISRDPRVLRLVNTVWPNVSPSGVLRDLLGDADTLGAAAEGVLDERERAAIVRPRATRAAREPWSIEDRVCLEELRLLITGEAPPRYRHIMVDEAQDLTPMQARSLARRCPSGSMTVLGDLAQATGDRSPGSWSETAELLAGEEGWHLEELAVGYRVPREVMDFVLPLARSIAPAAAFPRSIRPAGPGAVTVVSADPASMVAAAAERARAHAADGGRSVAAIAPPELLAPLRDALGDADRVKIVPPAEAKGLEFDHVVLVEPSAVNDRTLNGPGLLYVAATRCTRSLTVVHSTLLPPVLLPEPDAAQEGEPMTQAAGGESAGTNGGFEDFVAEIEAAVRAERRSTVHERVRHALISELYGAGLVPTMHSPTADVVCEGPHGKVLYEVLGEGGNTYRRMRDAVLRVLEVQHAEGDPVDHRFLVLPDPPAEPWAPDVLSEAFGMSVIWRDGPVWGGRAADMALCRKAPPSDR